MALWLLEQAHPQPGQSLPTLAGNASCRYTQRDSASPLLKVNIPLFSENLNFPSHKGKLEGRV